MAGMTQDQRHYANQICGEVLGEREGQHAKWGEQNHPDFLDTTSDFDNAPRIDLYQIPTAEEARDNCELAFDHGQPNWGSILLEEVCEAFEEGLSQDQLREELVQVAAVAVAWVEAIDRRKHAAVYAEAGKKIFGENDDAAAT